MTSGIPTVRRVAPPRPVLGVALALGLVASGTATAALPATGRYEGTLCVSNAGQPRSCGPADVDVRPGGDVRVRVSDIVYRLQLRAGQAAVVVMHGAMQVDEFDAGAEWAGSALRFADDEKRVRYEIRVGAPKPAPK